MEEYHKIHSLFKRDEKGKIILNDYSMPEFLYLENNSWFGTEKVDGTNIRVMWDGKTVRFGGRTNNAQIPTPLLNHLQDTFTKEKMISVFGEEENTNVCLYGEGYGNKIQKVGKSYLQDTVSFTKEGYTSLISEDENLRAEGIILIPEIPMLCRNGKRIITKLKYKDFTHLK